MNFKEILVKKHVNKTCLTCILDTQFLPRCMIHRDFPRLAMVRNNRTIELKKKHLMNWKIFLIVLSFELTIYSDCIYEIGLYGIGSV